MQEKELTLEYVSAVIGRRITPGRKYDRFIRKLLDAKRIFIASDSKWTVLRLLDSAKKSRYGVAKRCTYKPTEDANKVETGIMIALSRALDCTGSVEKKRFCSDCKKLIEYGEQAVQKSLLQRFGKNCGKKLEKLSGAFKEA